VEGVGLLVAAVAEEVADMVEVETEVLVHPAEEEVAVDPL